MMFCLRYVYKTVDLPEGNRGSKTEPTLYIQIPCKKPNNKSQWQNVVRSIVLELLIIAASQ